MSVQRMCQLAELPRASFYRWQPDKQGPDPDLELRDTIQRIALQSPATDGRAAPPSCGAAAGSSIPRRCSAFCGKTTCCACGGGSSC